MIEIGSRKTAEVTVSADNRDKGKKFLLTEMSARAADRWGMRALFAMGKSTADIPPETFGSGLEVLAFAGLKALLASPFPEVEPLLDELLECVQVVQPAGTRKLVENDIDEPSTYAWLRDEVLRLHTNFSIFDVLSSIQSRFSQTQPKVPNESDTRTSPA